jgi:hypothetical protein
LAKIEAAENWFFGNNVELHLVFGFHLKMKVELGHLSFVLLF